MDSEKLTLHLVPVFPPAGDEVVFVEYKITRSCPLRLLAARRNACVCLTDVRSGRSVPQGYKVLWWAVPVSVNDFGLEPCTRYEPLATTISN